jgi:HD-GYP domain-containing protein (c-di-GMP phosphodiesterase class II)
MEQLQTFFGHLTAVSQAHYQIWDSKGHQLFSTEKQQPDVLTLSSYLKMAKKVIQTNAFAYAKAERNGFVGGIPVTLDETTQGAVLAIGTRQRDQDENTHGHRLNAFLNQIRTLAENGNNNGDHQHPPPVNSPDTGFDDLYLFANISKQFRSLRVKQPVLGKLMHRMLDNMEADAAFLQLPAKPGYDLLEIRPALQGRNGDDAEQKAVIQRLITESIKQCYGNYCVINDSRDDAAFDALSDRPYGLLAVAVRHLATTYGWLGMIAYHLDSEFKPEALTILQTLANQLAAMLANMDHHEDLERFTVNMVCSLVNAIEAKDAYTQGHSKRVHRYSMQMAQHLDLPEDEKEALRWATVLHDIGKIGIPERILTKPGKLTDKEFALIKEHPVKGKTLLSPIGQLAPSMTAIAHHHERYDGLGYPDGLQGEEIPLTARIITVADTFDAITSKRSYHAAKTPKEAFGEMELVAGSQLDPDLVQIFKKAYRKMPWKIP